VLNAINAFNAKGLGALVAGSHVPQVIHRGFAEAAEKLRAMLHFACAPIALRAAGMFG
jgi:hypothetical protein